MFKNVNKKLLMGLTLSLAFAGSVNAKDNLYISLGGGINKIENNILENKFLPLALEHKFGYNIAGAIGYNTSSPISLELEGMYIKNELDKLAQSEVNEGYLDAKILFANFILNAPMKSKIGAYIGFGGGIGSIGVKNYILPDLTGNLDTTVNSQKFYQFIVGGKYRIKDNINLGIRYSYIKGYENSIFNYNSLDYNFDDLVIHRGTLNLEYQFGKKPLPYNYYNDVEEELGENNNINEENIRSKVIPLVTKQQENKYNNDVETQRVLPVEKENCKPEIEELKEVNKSFIIFFNLNSSKLTDEAIDILNMISRNIAKNNNLSNTNLEIKITGHSDSSGSEYYNMILSKKRADTVKRYLLSLGAVDESNILAFAKGESELLEFTNDNTAEPKNRRVEISYNDIKIVVRRNEACNNQEQLNSRRQNINNIDNSYITIENSNENIENNQEYNVGGQYDTDSFIDY